MTLVHATCVSVAGIGVLIRGPSGAGKSDLALRLIDGGCILVSDDYCDITVQDGLVSVSTPKAIAGKMEIRGHGITDVALRANTPIGLVVDLMNKENIPRLPESQTCIVEDVVLAHLLIDPDTPSAAAKVRLIIESLHTNAL